MFSLLKNKVVLGVIAVVLMYGVSFGFGWKVHSYYVGYQLNIERTVKEQIEEGLTQIQRDNAQSLLETQKKLDGIKSTVVVERIPTIIDRPIYLQRCLDEDGANILRDYKRESNKARFERNDK